jgi:hypothetical protein
MNKPSLRTQLYIAQAGVCCYCDKPMLMLGDISQKRFGLLYGRQDKSWVLFRSERQQNKIPPELRAA